MSINPTTLKELIDTQITNETVDYAITPAEVGGRMKDCVDYTTEQVGFLSYTAVVNYNSIVNVFKDTIGLSSPTITNPSNGKIVFTKVGVFTGIDVNKICFFSQNLDSFGSIYVTLLKQGGTLGENPDDKFTLNIFDMTGSQSTTPTGSVLIEIRIYQ